MMRSGLNKRVDDLETRAGMSGRVFTVLRWRGELVGVPVDATERDKLLVLNFLGLSEAPHA